MRSLDQTKGRQCIRPEMSRTVNFGEKGVSQSFYFETHVSQVALEDEKMDFSGLDLGYLEAERYHDYVISRMSKAVYLKYSNYLTTRPQDRDVIAVYHEDSLDPITKRIEVMGDHCNGMKRNSYKGVTIIIWNGNWAFIVQKGVDTA
ncbi:unnamed protein product [Chondrus crispus]|uniref:alpha-1,3-mannosyl-glycoprotein 2-beta-N-acetylglucosaminyltransferase n=1 Tax=Chondrus crispus TaxID=2769 RepID=R7QFT4_CHOCR|nr:unnamed protein product [Chondrus crispus]CDF36285.1 unnamed protein product [Chondrus crispus]|eukprot:XP_005716104.1 unnamed protein product [Chondrus crispus]